MVEFFKMVNNFSSKSIQVFVVEPNGSLRQGISAALKELGFTNILRFESLKDCAPLLQSENTPDWIITSLMKKDAANAFHLLEYCLRSSKMHRCSITILLDEDELFCIKEAFQLGILSWQVKGANTDKYKEDFQKLITAIERCGGDLCLTAFENLYAYLYEHKEYEEMEKLIKNISSIYTENLSISMKHCEVLFLQNKIPMAIKTIRHIRSLNPKYMKALDTVAKKYLGRKIDSSVDEDVSFAEDYDVENAIVIDPDETIHSAMKEIFWPLGIKDTNSFSRGEEAYEWISEHQDISLIIMEWKIPGMSGPALIQRIKSEVNANIPIIIHSSVVKESDSYLLKEMGITGLIKKPLYKKLLVEEVKLLLVEEKSGSNVDTQIKNIRNKIKSNDLAGAETLLNYLVNSENVNSALVDQVRAEINFSMGNMVKAKELALKALNSGEENLQLLDLLGKILLKLKEFSLSKKFLDKASRLSPHNIERLCALAETNMELGDQERSQAHLEQAKKVDKDSTLIQETEATIAINDGNIELAREIMNNISSVNNVVARLNNKAVFLVNQDQIDEAMSLYNKAFKTLHKKHSDHMETLLYNISLAYVRLGKLQKAEELLKKILINPDSRLYKKSKSLYSRIVQSLKTGKELILNTKVDDSESEEDLQPVEMVDSKVKNILPVTDNSKPGELCCHLIYAMISEPSDEVLKLLDNQPKFLKYNSLS